MVNDEEKAAEWNKITKYFSFLFQNEKTFTHKLETPLITPPVLKDSLSIPQNSAPKTIPKVPPR